MLLDFVFNENDAIPRWLEQTREPIIRKIEAVLRHIGQRFCGLRGHQALVHFEPDRVSLQCVRCGFQSRGWQIGKTSPLVRQRRSSQVKARTTLVRVHGRLA